MKGKCNHQKEQSTCHKSDSWARDRDVLLLLVAHVSHVPSPNLYMMSGTATKRNYFNIRAFYENLPAGSVSALAAFSCLNGLRLNILHVQPVTKISLEIPKAPHTSFLSRRERANRRKNERSRGTCL